jgi:hypothetical protein
MANTENKKGFRAGLYAGIAIPVMAIVLVALTVFAFKIRYNAFSPEKVAQNYVDTIIQSGDGYNAYKNTLVSKNQKFGDFIRNAYMSPFVNDGDDVKQAEFVGTGSDEEQKAMDEVYSQMYDYFLELLATYGFDDYDSIFNNYFAKLVDVRHSVFGDDYMDTEFMFGAFESNVATYGEYLKGTETVLASDNKTVIKEESMGAYQQLFGTLTSVETEKVVDGKKQTVTEEKLVYKLTCTVKESTALEGDEVTKYVEEYKERIAPVAASGETKTETYYKLSDDAKESMVSAFEKLDCSDEITAVQKLTVEVTLEDGTLVATQELYTVKIGSSWYVDNTNIDTSALYISNPASEI